MVKLLECKKAKSSIIDTLFGIVMLVSRIQFAKAKDPILVTLRAKNTNLKFEQPLNAAAPMSVTPLGITMLTSPLYAKAHAPIVVTLLGRLMLVNRIQF